MKILVTGSAGFIGYSLTKALLKRGDEVVGIDNINNYYDINLKYARLKDTGIDRKNILYNQVSCSTRFPNYSFYHLDLSDKKGIQNLFNNNEFDVVCNLAAQAGVRYSIENPDTYIESNLVGFVNILEACRYQKIEHLIYASSSSVYGLNQKIPFSTRDATNHPVSLYAATKKSNELMAHTYSHLYGIPTTGLRFFTVYGPWGRPDMAYFLFVKAILNNKPIKIFNQGQMSRDFTYIDDIVNGIIRVIGNSFIGNNKWNSLQPAADSSSAPYRIYNIGNNSPVNLLKFIETIEASLGKKTRKVMLPMQPGDVEVTYANIDGLRNDFAYKPTTTIEEGISAFVRWYKLFYKK